VTLRAKKATDPNSDPLSYEFVLHEDSVQAAPIDSISGVVPLYSSTEVLWQVSAPLKAGKVYFWSCRAFDGAKRSPWAGHRRFWTPSGDTAIVVNPPVADFVASPESGYAPLTVGFSDRSTNNPASWQWNFGDGQISPEQNPVHNYATPGVYTVALTVTNAGGSDTKSVPNLITVIEPQVDGKVYASGERTIAGTISGSYIDTRESDGSCQVLTEVVSRPGTTRTYSLVDHRWRFVLAPSQWKTLFVTAHSSDNGDRDDFRFEYSLNDTLFIPLLVVNSATERVYSAAIPGNVTGSVIIRVIDTDHSRYKTSLDQVYIDQMYIESSNGIRPPDTLYVQGIELTVPPSTSVNYYARAAVTIFNQRNAPAVGVQVGGHFEGPSADVVTGVTGIDGRVVFQSAKVKNPVGAWAFHVDAVSRDGDIYGADRNVETYEQAKAAVIPEQFELFQNYPNPFNPTTRIEFSLPQPGKVRLDVYNIAGQVVQTLIDGQLDAGYHGVVWDGRDGDGRPVASGIYFYRLQTADVTATRKMVLLK
jgi:PKD repeat protein